MKEVWYPKNRKKHIAAVKKLKNKLAFFMDTYKRERKCADCGFSGAQHPYVLDFYHRNDSRKSFDVGSYAQHVLSVKSLSREILKCDLVCANCHRIRTWKHLRSSRFRK